MQTKRTLFKALKPLSRYYRALKVFSLIQFCVCIALPVFYSELDTVVWLLVFSLFAFFVSSYAVLRLAYHHDPEKKGFRGWISGLWENLIFTSWLLVIILITVLVFKLVLFMHNNPG